MDIQRILQYVRENRDNVILGAVVLVVVVGGGIYYLNQNRKKAEDVQVLYVRAMMGDPGALNLLKKLVTDYPNTLWGKMAAVDLMLADLFQGREKSASGYVKFLKDSKNPILKSTYYSHGASFKLSAGNVQDGLRMLGEGEGSTDYVTFRDYFRFRKATILYTEGRYEEARKLLKEIANNYDSPYREDARALLRKVKLLSEGG